MQVILGSGGAIGKPLATALAAHADRVRCVSRTPHVLPKGDGSTTYEHRVADLLDCSSVEGACAGATVVYLVVGLAYDSRVWARDWPRVVEHVLSACAKTGARLAFFDNVYAYAETGYADLHENVDLDPPSFKGRIRKAVRERLLLAHKQREVEVTIAVAADFYGPGIANSVLLELVANRLVAGRGAQWLGDPDVPHSFTYTPDAGRHLALLANDDRAYGDVWHLPTAAPAWTARDWTKQLAQALQVKPKLARIPKGMWWLLSRLSRPLRELYDVRAQVLLPYRFNSTKFEQTFGVVPTSYSEGLQTLVGHHKK